MVEGDDETILIIEYAKLGSQQLPNEANFTSPYAQNC